LVIKKIPSPHAKILSVRGVEGTNSDLGDHFGWVAADSRIADVMPLIMSA
jgi:hypothetical protein